ncbi:late embryogenesis abundant protein Lea5 [Cicer arietinum]|uniref:Late embryogenesis abundant protein Lea5 n=1 Tax=Cicer arietinum TaxID=3827 RepID=A0A1S2YQ70_CICAR|nr:late embryogenesis abundant protein Lea5 [Cicer arietinum]
MALSLSQSNRLCTLLAQSLPLFHRRGFAAASDASVRIELGSVAKGHGKLGSLEEKPVSRDGSEACSAWAPDPETGYYRPINHIPKIDPVELRNLLLKHNSRSSN